MCMKQGHFPLSSTAPQFCHLFCNGRDRNAVSKLRMFIISKFIISKLHFYDLCLLYCHCYAAMNEQATDDGLFLKVENDTIEWTLNLHIVLVVQIFIDVELKNPKGTEMLNKQN